MSQKGFSGRGFERRNKILAMDKGVIRRVGLAVAEWHEFCVLSMLL